MPASSVSPCRSAMRRCITGTCYPGFFLLFKKPPLHCGLVGSLRCCSWSPEEGRKEAILPEPAPSADGSSWPGPLELLEVAPSWRTRLGFGEIAALSRRRPNGFRTGKDISVLSAADGCTHDPGGSRAAGPDV